MPFTDEEKISNLKDAMRRSVDQGTDWDTLKTEFAACSEAFRAETMDFLDQMKDTAESRSTRFDDRKGNLDDLIEELE